VREDAAVPAPASPPPRVTVLVTVRDPDPRLLRLAVQSALAQTFRDFELLVVEDPGARPAAAALSGLDDPRLRVTTNAAPLPLAAARNRGLEMAAGELVAILDCDDECAPERLAAQVAFLDAHRDIAVVGSQLEVVDEGGVRLGFRSYPTAHQDLVAAMRRRNPLAHPSVMFRRAVVQQHGGYRSLGDDACDDYELWSRLAQAGVQFANLPAPLLRYRLHGGAMKQRRLRATLRDTLAVKQIYWRAQMNFGDHLAVLGERAALWLPAPLVLFLFRRRHLRARLGAS
jgi:glycosyltransferase involved in cell wall biosynthesis